MTARLIYSTPKALKAAKRARRYSAYHITERQLKRHRHALRAAYTQVKSTDCIDRFLPHIHRILTQADDTKTMADIR